VGEAQRFHAGLQIGHPDLVLAADIDAAQLGYVGIHPDLIGGIWYNRPGRPAGCFVSTPDRVYHRNGICLICRSGLRVQAGWNRAGGMTMANSALVKKLQIKPNQRMVVVNAPAGYLEDLGSLPAGVELSTRPEGQYDAVQLFVQNRAQLEELFPAALRALKEDGLFWIAYPKQSSAMETDLNRDEGWEAVYKAGLRAVSSVAIDDTWSAVRLRPAEFSSEQEMVEAQYAGKKAARSEEHTSELQS